MIKNFENITFELTQYEKDILPALIDGFSMHKKENPIKAPDIIKSFNRWLEMNHFKTRINEVRLRKMVNYIRVNSLLPLMATSKGYYVTEDVEEIKSQIRSLEERASSIKDAANGLYWFVENKMKGMAP